MNDLPFVRDQTPRDDLIVAVDGERPSFIDHQLQKIHHVGGVHLARMIGALDGQMNRDHDADAAMDHRSSPAARELAIAAAHRPPIIGTITETGASVPPFRS